MVSANYLGCFKNISVFLPVFYDYFFSKSYLKEHKLEEASVAISLKRIQGRIDIASENVQTIHNDLIYIYIYIYIVTVYFLNQS